MPEEKCTFNHSAYCCFDLNITHNKEEGGAGHGGFIELEFIDRASTNMECEARPMYQNSNQCSQMLLRFRGDDEVSGLIDVLEEAINFLRTQYPKIDSNYFGKALNRYQILKGELPEKPQLNMDDILKQI